MWTGLTGSITPPMLYSMKTKLFNLDFLWLHICVKDSINTEKYLPSTSRVGLVFRDIHVYNPIKNL